MEEVELSHYNNLTNFQKEVVSVLVELGFKHKYFSTYELIGWGNINVSNFYKWSDILKYVHEDGKDQKRFELHRVLGI